jgi:hypothetical protein
MFNPMFRPCTRRMRFLAGTAVAALVIGCAAGAGAQTSDPSIGPQQASLPANDTAADPPAVPLGRENAREVQNQLISLGFDPGPADGQIGPATIAAAQQYDLSRGGDGRVSVDGALLARLKEDTAPRLTYDQVAARSRARQQTGAPASASASGQAGSVMQQIAPLLGAIVSNSNNNRGYYGPGYYGPGPGYYGPPPGYYGYGYGGY